MQQENEKLAAELNQYKFNHQYSPAQPKLENNKKAK